MKLVEWTLNVAPWTPNSSLLLRCNFFVHNNCSADTAAHQKQNLHSRVHSIPKKFISAVRPASHSPPPQANEIFPEKNNLLIGVLRPQIFRVLYRDPMAWNNLMRQRLQTFGFLELTMIMSKLSIKNLLTSFSWKKGIEFVSGEKLMS